MMLATRTSQRVVARNQIRSPMAAACRNSHNATTRNLCSSRLSSSRRGTNFSVQTAVQAKSNPLGRVSRVAVAAPPSWSHQSIRKSTTAASTTSESAAAAKPAVEAAAKEAEPAPIRDFFLDNLGKIFLTAIACVIASLVRSSYGTSNMKDVREALEAAAALDPLEIDALRQVNTELTPALFRTIVQELMSPSNQMNKDEWTYLDFVKAVRAILYREKGDGCTIGMGYLLDRVVITVLQQRKQREQQAPDSAGSESSLGGESGFSSEMKHNTSTMPLTFWLVVLSLAMNGPVPDRIRILYEILEMQRKSANAIKSDDGNVVDFGNTESNNTNNNNDNNIEEQSSSSSVTLSDVITMVEYLQETDQLVPDTQVVPTETKYPTQQYRRGTPEELVQWQAAADDSTSNNSISKEECLDLDAFAGILRTKSVCAWGECYHKKKYVP